MRSSIQNACFTAICCSLTLFFGPNLSGQNTKSDNPYNLSVEQVQWMKQATRKQLEGSRVEGAGGTYIHTPDGVGNYKALWTRDYYYMVEYAGDLLDPGEIKASIFYLLNGQRDDGCIPDRVNIAGEPVYSPGPPGKPMADHALDNSPFMAMLVCSYVNQYKDAELFRQIEPNLREALDFVTVGEKGLVYNDPGNPQCVYGFTDIIMKTGNLLFSSLLYYKANLEMYKLCIALGCGNPGLYKERYEKVKANIDLLWNKEQGMFWAADIDCKQIDIWGSAYAVQVGIVSEMQARRISDYMAEHFGEIVLRGQLRHLTLTEGTWNKLFKPCEKGTYQNGAYWATPLAWSIPVIAISNPDVAGKMLETVITDFQENGINECVNNGYVKVPNFVVSATNVYSLTR
jgi:hypothetical protein